MEMASYANIAAAERGSAEMFDDVLRMQSQLATDFLRHDEREERFKKQFARETRRHHSAISGMSCEVNATAASNAVLYAPSKALTHHQIETDDPPIPARRGSVVSRQLQRLKNPQALRLRDQLASFHLPAVVTTDIVCDACGAFKSTGLVTPLPEPWREYTCDNNGDPYFYNPATRQVLWSPPPETSPFGVFVFERTRSVASVCRCIPSRERRVRCMEKFREYARQAAKEETEKRNRQLHGAFKVLTHAILEKKS